MVLMLLSSLFYPEGGKYNSQGREMSFVYLSESSGVPVDVITGPGDHGI
jgi:hypothetical protein